MATFNKFNTFVEHLSEGVHNLQTGALTIALTNAANAPSASADSVLADLTQISYANISSRVVGSPTSSAQASGTYKLVLPDLVLTASGNVAAFRYVILYNDTPTSPADPLIGWYDYGSEVAMSSGDTFTIDFDAANGVLTLA